MKQRHYIVANFTVVGDYTVRANGLMITPVSFASSDLFHYIGLNFLSSFVVAKAVAMQQHPQQKKRRH